MSKLHLAIVALLASSGAASADLLYGIDAQDSSIFTLDTGSGSITKYFGHPAGGLGGLDFDSSGNLYVQQFGSLYQIDNLAGGLWHEIGSNNNRAFESFEIIGNTGYAADVFDGGIYSIDLATNIATFIGFHGDSNSRITGLASDEGNTLYGARIFQNDIVSVDASTGLITGTITPFISIDNNATSLALGSSNNLWTSPAFSGNLYSVDIATGNVTTVWTGLGLGHCTALTSIPAPGSLGMLGIAGLACARRRR